MAYEILISPSARNDLLEIYQYIAEDLNAVQSAIGQLERLERAIYSLDEMPERYPRYDREPWFSRNLHFRIFRTTLQLLYVEGEVICRYPCALFYTTCLKR